MLSGNESEAFPWHLGVFDAHCHPTDTMSSIQSIPNMSARCLTVMGTRSQDQALVADVADEHGIKSDDWDKWSRKECMVPCFGWHPWFAHQMYIAGDETQDQPNENSSDGKATGVLQGDDKIKHYQNVLQPHREDPVSETERELFLTLPDPTSFSDFLLQTRKRLEKYPYALIGEIGLDRSFRLPFPPDFEDSKNRDDSLTPGGREGRRLTSFRCDLKHQKAIYKKQLQLAAECKRAVSIHGVQAHGMVYDALKELWSGHEKEVISKRELKRRGADHRNAENEIEKSDADSSPKPYPPRVCLHSYSGTAANLNGYFNPAVPVDVFVSFSTAINLGDALEEETPQSFVEVIKAVPDHRLLVESDLHTAGQEMDKRLEDIVRRVCSVKGWGLEDGVRRLGKNWRRFIFGVVAEGFEFMVFLIDDLEQRLKKAEELIREKLRRWESAELERWAVTAALRAQVRELEARSRFMELL
ncbi:Metallo-dependent hydrolase [Byssothecium circinans]|uniref:Metallo-dependent hydrolase n=1 Tax=Byssothecium circinans TaxID=147558 RepID=A0A6A5TFY1_9PLEO|nr:Metallo-dependent hydrolase [Byssothecium circinans]